jgi:tryptophanyl-tRNA synthetase
MHFDIQMARVLTGTQSSGKQHLGNILGAIKPAVELSKDPSNESFLFIADLHSLVSIKDGKMISENTHATACAWLAMGLDTEKTVFYRQSDVAEVCELAWILNCFTPFPMLENAHSFKDKSANLADVNAGLFTYPVLMASDILLYDAQIVPVGKDQRQHLEMTRDIAGAFNHKFPNTFVLPEAKIQESVMTIPGIDGRKMSKSYQNYIDVFLPEKELRKKVMSIVTESKTLEEPKDPDTCNVFKLYSLLATEGEILILRNLYLGGNFGYGTAKQMLYEKILSAFSNERIQYDHFFQHPELVHAELLKGADKARQIARPVLKRVRNCLGLA